jgi:hypothetical protein
MTGSATQTVTELGRAAARTAASRAARTALSRGGARAAHLDEHRAPRRAILRAIPYALTRRFDPAAALALDTTLELRVTDSAGGPEARFAIRIAGGACRISRGAAPDSHAQAAIGADDMIRLASGAVGWPELLATGRLQLSGDPFLALRFPNLFRLPAGDK